MCVPGMLFASFHLLTKTKERERTIFNVIITHNTVVVFANKLACSFSGLLNEYLPVATETFASQHKDIWWFWPQVFLSLAFANEVGRRLGGNGNKLPHAASVYGHSEEKNAAGLGSLHPACTNQ